MNEGGKVVFSGRNGWVQQTSTGTGLRTTPATRGGRSPCTGSTTRPTRPATTTARTRRSSASSTSPTTGPSGGSASAGARAAWARPRTTPRRCRPSSGSGSSTGMTADRARHLAGDGDTLEPTQNATTGRPSRGRRRRRGCATSRVHVRRDPSWPVPRRSRSRPTTARRRPPRAGRSSPRATPCRSASAWSRSPTRASATSSSPA